MPAKSPITVQLKDDQIVVQPERKEYPRGDWTIVWQPVGDLEITGIHFEGAHDPISKPRKGSDGRWTSENKNHLAHGEKAFKYGVSVRRDGQDYEVDPEIVNQAKPDDG